MRGASPRRHDYAYQIRQKRINLGISEQSLTRQAINGLEIHNRQNMGDSVISWRIHTGFLGMPIIMLWQVRHVMLSPGKVWLGKFNSV